MHSLILVVLAGRNEKKGRLGKKPQDERTNERTERERGRVKDRIPEEEAQIKKAMKATNEEERKKKSDWKV